MHNCHRQRGCRHTDHRSGQKTIGVVPLSTGKIRITGFKIEEDIAVGIEGIDAADCISYHDGMLIVPAGTEKQESTTFLAACC